MNTYGIDKTLDIVCVGAGPAALGVLHAAKESGLDAVAIDKGPVCSALCSHPTYMRWFSTFDKLELAGFPLVITEKNPTRQEYLKYCRTFVRYFDLKIATYHEVTSLRRARDVFEVAAKDLFGRERTWRSRYVVVATGFYDSPRPMNVPGENLPKVSHRYTEAHWYADHDVLIVGGGSSAAEIALELWRNGTRVTIAMRGDRFETKYWIEPDIENRIAEGSITCYRNAEVAEIRPDDVVLRDQYGKDIVVPNDFVLAMTGYEPDTSLVDSLGATIDQTCGKPVLSEHFETNVPGMYVAGTLCAGQESNIVFIENSRDHGPAIVRHIISHGA
ncbi:MAG: YpdA family putative bacillithiol disulfide reductase [Candidatus Hydrogenedentes bacterium]|nr:YpdA family putative bacillithiol disulfide reductase [Candidatus Hydrogenedentota bacterium]